MERLGDTLKKAFKLRLDKNKAKPYFKVVIRNCSS